MKSPHLKYLYVILYFISCGHKNCEVVNYQSANWQVIDSTLSFYICPNSGKILNETDSIEIEYLGISQESEDKVIRSESDKTYFSLLTNSRFGRFKYGDTTLSGEIRNIIKQMSKESVATIKYTLTDKKTFEPERRVTVYFKDNTDSAEAIKWINKIQTIPFIDSTIFLSKDAALKDFMNNMGDTSFLSVLTSNPLPSSVDLFIKSSHFDTTLIRKLKIDLMKSDIVSSVIHSSFQTAEKLKAIYQMLTNIYLIRIKSID